MATTSAEEAELLCQEFAKNSLLDDCGRNPPPFPPRTGEKLSPPTITVKAVCGVINCLASDPAAFQSSFLSSFLQITHQF